jgi:hypothetical protein
MPSKYLIEHARANVWCTPEQDFQVVIAPMRISEDRGVRRSMRVEMGQDISMPDIDAKFHVWQIGNLHPGLIGLFPRAGHWVRATDHMNVQGMMINVYNKMGEQVPRFEVWFVVLPDRNLLMAIEEHDDRYDFIGQQTFVRFYSNAFYESVRSQGLPQIPSGTYIENPINDWANLGGLRASGTSGDVLIEGKRSKTRNDIMVMQNRYTQLKALNVGQVTCFYNGRLVPDFDGTFYTAAVWAAGDWCEIVVDASMTEIVQFKVNGLDTYDSTLDSVRKYLLHRLNDKLSVIQFKDDLDIYLTRPIGTDGRFEGRYYYQNTKKAVRQVTHQDWSMPVAFVAGFKDAAFTNPQEWTIRVYTRKSGYDRKLVNEAARIQELYRLSAAQRRRAMLGLDSTMSYWRAPNLEANMYAFMMQDFQGNFTVEQVQEGYGYNAISKLVADSPIAVTNQNGNKVVVLPAGLQTRATIYEYDVNGLLLGYYQTSGTIHYSCRNASCAFVEGRVGTGGPNLTTVFGVKPFNINPDWDYFCLKAQVWNGTISGGWLPAELDKDYVIRDGQIRWNLDGTAWVCAIRNNEFFLSYDIELDARDGLMIFSVQSEEANDFEPANRVEPVPYGKLDIWLNRRPLIENIDYVVKWPQVVICNKEFIRLADTQAVTVRCTGLPMLNADGEFYRQLPLDYGFVQYGQLSRNNRYNVRMDKVQRVVVRGKVMTPSQVKYPEEGTAISSAAVKNGDPYAIEEVIVPIGLFTTTGTYPLRAAAMERDRQVEDYMTRFIKDPVPANYNPVEDLYDLFSPFLAKVIRDLQHGYLVIDPTQVPLTNAQVRELLKDYTYLLDYDPTRLDLPTDYVTIHAHDSYDMITLGVYHFYLLEMAVKLFMPGLIDVSRWVQIDSQWAPIQI